MSVLELHAKNNNWLQPFYMPLHMYVMETNESISLSGSLPPSPADSGVSDVDPSSSSSQTSDIDESKLQSRLHIHGKNKYHFKGVSPSLNILIFKKSSLKARG